MQLELNHQLTTCNTDKGFRHHLQNQESKMFHSHGTFPCQSAMVMRVSIIMILTKLHYWGCWQYAVIMVVRQLLIASCINFYVKRSIHLLISSSTMCYLRMTFDPIGNLAGGTARNTPRCLDVNQWLEVKVHINMMIEY